MIGENAANGTVVGLTVLAVDPDPTAVVAYTLNDDAGGRFAIDAVSGVVVASTVEAISLEHLNEDGARVVVHFPRLGFEWRAA